MARKIMISLVVTVMASCAGGWLIPARAWAASGLLLISEVKLGGGDDPKEFIEIFNDTGAPIDLSLFAVEYAKTTFDPASCGAPSWKLAATSSSQVNYKPLSGVVPHGSFTTVEISLNDNSAGSIRLYQLSTAFTLDQLGWGSASPCYLGQSAAQPANGLSLSRRFDAQAGLHLVSPRNNLNEFVLSTMPTPGQMGCTEPGCPGVAPPPADPDPDPLPNPPDDPDPSVLNVQITELLPDPASPLQDSNDEYIELYNPNSTPLDLSGYVLYTSGGSSADDFNLSGIVIAANSYLALYSSQTGLSLVNSGGRAWLTSPGGFTISETSSYPSSLGTGKAWALIEGSWQAVSALTPGDANPPLSSSLAVAQDDKEDEVETTLRPCPTGKYRNPDTNRCRNIEEPEALTPCSEGQERNPETNRCRKIASVSSVLADCQSGYERNPETNRCRKITAVKGAAVVATPDSNSSQLNYWLIAGVSTLIFGYAVFEYRKDIGLVYGKLKSRIIRR